MATLGLVALAPLRMYAQCPDGTPPPCRAGRPSPPPNSLAILYFENLSPDTADVYLADGLTEELTVRLGKIPRLTLASRTAVRRVRNAGEVGTAELGRRLNVTYLVSGSVRRAGPRLRVSVELVRADGGARIWGDQFDRSGTDLLDLQEDIGQAITTGVAGTLLPAERATLAARPTRNPEAYDYYLRGNRLLWSGGAANALGAIREYESALRLDPTFTAARGRLASACMRPLYEDHELPGFSPESLSRCAATQADRALREDSTVADAWLGRAFVRFIRGGPDNVADGLAAMRRAVELQPGDDGVHEMYASLLRRAGRFDAAEQEYQRALLINPLHVAALSDLALFEYWRRHYDDARRWVDSALALDSTMGRWHQRRAYIRSVQGDGAGALADARTAVRLASTRDRGRAEALLATMEARAGDAATARARLDTVLTRIGWRSGAATEVSQRVAVDAAIAALALGDRDLALSLVEAGRPRDGYLWGLLLLSDLDPVRDDPRFARLLAAVRPPGAQELR